MEVTKLIEHFGGPSAISKMLNIRSQSVITWKKNNKVPLKRAIQIEQLTDGEILARDIRPDVFEAQLESA